MIQTGDSREDGNLNNPFDSVILADTISTFVYILASRKDGALYVGSTDNPAARIFEHRAGRGSKHVAKYSIFRLVYLESYDRAEDAILRERRIKKWNRAWKIRLIEETNPHWQDLYDQLQNMI